MFETHNFRNKMDFKIVDRTLKPQSLHEYKKIIKTSLHCERQLW